LNEEKSQTMKKILLVLTAALALGCGGDDETGSSGGGEVDAILALSGNSAAGSAVYTQTCGISSCHGSSGNNGSQTAGDLPVAVPAASDSSIVTTVIKGQDSMPAQGALEDQQVADVLAYLRDTFQ
jgi:mono/diheme cytochrome c family protein